MVGRLRYAFLAVLVTLFGEAASADFSWWFEGKSFGILQKEFPSQDVNKMCVTEGGLKEAIHKNDRDSFRVSKFVRRVLSGEAVKMVVIGGSNSAGGGVPDHRKLYHQLFYRWWNQAILPRTGSTLTVENLSLGGTGSYFYSFCLQNYLPQGEGGPDLVVIELSVNDYGSQYGTSAQPMEQLTRRLLSLSSAPLVFYVTLVDLIEKTKWWTKVLNPRCLNLEDLGQFELARYYNISIFSWRDVVCPLKEKPLERRIRLGPGMINKDHFHIGTKGHAQIALMMSCYFTNVFQRVDKYQQADVTNREVSVAIKVPLFIDNVSQPLITNPICWSLISPDWRRSIIHQTLQVRVLKNKGFSEVAPQSPSARMAQTEADRNDSFGGWRSRRNGSLLQFSFFAPYNVGQVRGWSVGVVLRHLQGGGIDICLNGNHRGSVFITGRMYGRVLLQTRVYFMEVTVSSGYHKLQVKTMAERNFSTTISGIVLGPPGIKEIKEYNPYDTLQKVWSREDYHKLRV